MGFGFVVARFGLFLRELGAVSTDTPVRSSGFSLAAGTVMVLLGVGVNLIAARQHVKVIRDLNASRVWGHRPAPGWAFLPRNELRMRYRAVATE
jgi:putative membrane protein